MVIFRHSILIVAGLVLNIILTACNEQTVAVVYPNFIGSIHKRIRTQEVYTAYKTALIELIQENTDIKPYKKIPIDKLQFIIDDNLYAEYLDQGALLFDQKIKKYDADLILHTEIIQPKNEIDFSFAKLHLYFRNGHRAHHSLNYRLGDMAFSTTEYWKSEFRSLLRKLEKNS